MVIDITLKNELKKYLEEKIFENKKRALIISSYKMEKSELKDVIEAIPALRLYEITNMVDPKILGGFIIKFDSKIIDFSILSQLNKFKKEIYEIS